MRRSKPRPPQWICRIRWGRANTTGTLQCDSVELIFESGITERHQVRFTFNKFMGGLSISVDGIKVVRQVAMLSLGLVKSYEFVVGDQEKHVVKIEKHRKRFFAGFRSQPVLAYVDGQLVAKGVA